MVLGFINRIRERKAFNEPAPPTQKKRKRSKFEDVPGLIIKIGQLYPDRHSLKKNHIDHLSLRLLFIEKSFQSLVLLPYFGINTPYTLPANEFKGEFFPAFLKSNRHTIYIPDKSRYENEIAQLDPGILKYYIMQQNIEPATQIATHIRLVVTTSYFPPLDRENKLKYGIDNALADELSIRGAVVLYSTNPDEHRSNHKHGGKAIALTGKGALENITEYEAGLLTDLGIDPNRRRIPAEIISDVFEKRDMLGYRLHDYLHYVDNREVGLDFMLGCPSSGNEKLPCWYGLETQTGPDNDALHETHAWIAKPSSLE
jgi:hypothetical protein